MHSQFVVWILKCDIPLNALLIHPTTIQGASRLRTLHFASRKSGTHAISRADKRTYSHIAVKSPQFQLFTALKHSSPAHLVPSMFGLRA